MPPYRQVKTCGRCRELKVRCDKQKPTCQRCGQAGAPCSFQNVLSPPSTSSSPENVQESHSDVPTPVLAPVVTDQQPSHGIADQDHHGALSTGSSKSKKRQRACLSCVRCHRLKVKCDKKQPCTRCRQSGFGPQCAYTHRIDIAPVQREAGFDSLTVDDKNPHDVATSWHCRARGASHWKELLNKVKLLSRLVSPLLSEERHFESVAEGPPTNLILPINYPFNSPGASKYASTSAVWSLIQQHHRRCSRYIDRYMSIFHEIHPILNKVEVKERVEAFWKNGASDDVSWLAQFCLILALGVFAETRDSNAARELCLAGEACLSQTAFMVRPSLSCLQTMCLMVMAKQMGNGTCWTIDSCWTLLGFVIRQAACLGLHRQPAPFTNLKPHALDEWRSGQTVWVTILYFSIQVSISSGMPSFMRADELLYSNETFPWITGIQGAPEQAWQTVVRTTAPMILEIVARVNSDNDHPSYRETMDYNTQIRQSMSIIDSYDLPESLRIAFDIHFRRVLLILHRRYALEPDGPYTYSVSYWASLECSLAILVHQREMSDDKTAKSDMYMASRFFMLDFFGAALTASIHLLREDALLADGVGIPPRQTILSTLQDCVDIWAVERTQSVCFRSGYRLLKEVLELLYDRDKGRDWRDRAVM